MVNDIVSQLGGFESLEPTLYSTDLLQDALAKVRVI